MMLNEPLAAFAILVAALVLPVNAHAQRLTIAVSTPEVSISSNFTGATVTVFGVIEGTAGTSPLEQQYDVALVVLGPPESVVARRKDRLVGIWANSGAATIIGVPSFYAVDSSAAIAAIAPTATLSRLQLGFDNIEMPYGEGVRSADIAEFRDAFLRLKARANLYHEQTGIEFIGDTIFRSNTFLPANIPDGRYTVLAYLFSDRALVARAESSITVSKIGFEEVVAGFATGQSLIYGLMCATLALFIGWLGGVIFRRD